MVSLNVNGLSVEANATPDTPLLWVLRDHLGLTGAVLRRTVAQVSGNNFIKPFGADS